MSQLPPIGDWTWIIGEVVAFFGVRGEMKVRVMTDFPDRFSELEYVCLRLPNGDARIYPIESVRFHKEQALTKLVGIDGLDRAEAWRGALVQIPRAQAVSLPDDAYYISDLIGLTVFTKSGIQVGKIEDVLKYPAHEVLQIGDILIPAVKAMVLSVDTEAGIVVIDPPDGLLPGTVGEVVESTREEEDETTE